MRQRKSHKAPVDSVNPSAAQDNDVNGMTEDVSLLKGRCVKDFVARFFFVGIFITENLLHAVHFEAEIDGMVAPALAPLPREVAVSLHVVHIVFGMFGAIFVLVSGFDTAGRTALTKGTSMMLVFMSTITWTWWINRQGIPYWKLDEYPFWDVRCSAEKRNRTVHILKNISIVGALTIFQQMAKYETMSQKTPPSFLEGLVTALRPWSFTASLAPHLVLLAVIKCLLKMPLPGYTVTIMLILSIMAVQAVANLVNSLKDFERGVDTKETAGDRTLVDSLVSTSTLKLLTALCLAWYLSFFAWSVWATGGNGLVLGLATSGVLLALGYTAGPAPLKYMGLGDLVVLFCFGPGVISYSSVVLTNQICFQILAFTAPVTLYVIATLHANNYRDIEADARAGVKTVAITLGPQASLHYYTILLAGAHAGALAAGWYFGCVGSIASLFVLPQSIWLCFRIRCKSLLHKQDEETAKTTLFFGVALSLGIMTMPSTEISIHGLGVSALVVLVLKVFAN